MKKDIVQYSNDFNTLRLTGFKAIDLDLLMLICSKVKNHETELLEIPFSEMKGPVGMANRGDKFFWENLSDMAVRLRKLSGSFKTETQFREFDLFTDFFASLEDVVNDPVYGDVKAKTLLVSVNPRYAFLLNELSREFTAFELSEFVRLESKYSKNLYRLLKQYRRSGTYKVNAEKFRELMDCPKSYPNKEFMRIAVNVAIKELSRGYFENLKVKPVRGKGRGNPIVSYEFTFKKSENVPGQLSMNDYDGPTLKDDKKPKRNKFNNFKQREYDYEQLEKDLLQAQRRDMETDE